MFLINDIFSRFERDNGVMMTVGEYFEKEKNYRLRYPYLPCIHLGNENKTNYIPIEVSDIRFPYMCSVLLLYETYHNKLRGHCGIAM